MARRSTALIVLLSICSCTCFAQHFTFSPNCRDAYNRALELRLGEAAVLIEAERAKDPGNMVPHLLDNYIAFLQIFVTESQEDYQRLRKRKDERLGALRRKADRSSPYYLYTLGEIHMQWAICKIKFGDYFSALIEIRKAMRLLRANQAAFPEFKANSKSLGLLHAIIGSIPDRYKWGLNFLGMDGDIQAGLAELKSVLDEDPDFVFAQEAELLYALLLFHLEKKKSEAWAVLRDDFPPGNANTMATFVLAHIGVHGGYNGEAIEYLETRPRDPAYTEFPYMHFLLGLAKLYRQDPSAEAHFLTYLSVYRGGNHIKHAHQKLGWARLLQGDSLGYQKQMQLVLAKGSAVVDADKQAMLEAKSGKAPQRNLLRARLQCDGGLYADAETTLKELDMEKLAGVKEQTEYLYRLGRIYHEWGRTEDCIPYYRSAIEKGAVLPHYFAANSALQLGLIFEGNGSTDEALTYYRECLAFDSHEYKNSIDQKAKAGINRIINRQ